MEHDAVAKCREHRVQPSRASRRTGYPRKLKGDEIPPPVRMLTIADIYDALTASDRPYKKAVPRDKALDILTKEFAQRGKVDPLYLDVFVEKRLYEAV